MPFYEFHLNCFIANDTPLEIKSTLQYMLSKDKLNKPEYVSFSKDKFKIFNYNKWDTFLAGSIPHFPFSANSYLISNKTDSYLSISCSFLSTDDCVIYDFIDWIKPYIISNNYFLGYVGKFQEAIELLFLVNGKIISKIVDHAES